MRNESKWHIKISLVALDRAALRSVQYGNFVFIRHRRESCNKIVILTSILLAGCALRRCVTFG